VQWRPQFRHATKWIILPAAVTLTLATSSFPAAARAGSSKQWPSGGQNPSNTRSNPSETQISPSTVGSLSVKWTFTTTGDVTASPAIVGKDAYFPDSGGYLDAVNISTGTLKWRRQISTYDGISGSYSRTSPAVSGGVVYIGDHKGANLMAIRATTGKLLWKTQLDSHPYAMLTASPLFYKGVVYEGVSSSEEGAASDPGYSCCTFRGSVAAVKARTGKILWKAPMVPDNGGTTGGYSGGAVWSSTPALDPSTKTLYVTTGNNYTVPASVTTCQANGGTPKDCLANGDDIDAIVAIDASTGKIRWADNQGGFDAWTTGCDKSGHPNCPTVGPDADFGSGAQLFHIHGPHGPELVVGAGEKSGTYWAADAATGHILWGTPAGPEGYVGGIQWGTATDGTRIYVAEADSDSVAYTPEGSAQSITYGSWAALDPATGAILWQTPDPSGGTDTGAVSSADGVVYAESMTGHMYALSGATGQVLWSFTGAGSSIAGPAIVDGVVYWGNGYAAYGGTGSTTFYAFHLAPGGDGRP
jgi:polyvinyl alcohol dehydrogenase (cytochrome)